MATYDAVVIGAGPAGLTAALYLCRFGVKTALLEKLTPGGQLLSTFEICNYPGFPDGVAGWTLAEGFSSHLEKYNLDRYARNLHRLVRDGKLLRLETDKEKLEAKAVVICSGASPKKLGLADEERLIGKGVSFCAMCDGMLFKNKVVAMVGGGNAALEEALHLANLVEKLYLVHRRDHFRADKVYRDKIRDVANIEIVPSHHIVRLLGDDRLTGIDVEPLAGGPKRTLEVSGLFVFIGNSPSAHFFPHDLPVDEAGFVVTDAEMRTGIPGVFAAGDIRSKQCRQVVTAVGDGATAAYSAFAYLEHQY